MCNLRQIGLFCVLATSTVVSIAIGDDRAVARHSVDVGLQVYSLRAQMAKDFAGSLDEVEKWGVTDVELGAMFDHTAEQYRAELDKRHLKATGIHHQWHDFLTNLDGIIKDAKTLGCEYVTLPWIPHKGAFALDDAKTAAAKFNEWGEKLAAAGLHFTYHAHGYEFRPGDNGTLFDYIAANTSPKWVGFELDVFWAYDAGADPIKLMQKYPDRFPQLHLKDMAKSEKVPNYGERKVDKDQDVTLGTGQIDIAGILKQARAIGVKHYYIEDESSKSEQQIPPSIAYIHSVTDGSGK